MSSSPLRLLIASDFELFACSLSGSTHHTLRLPTSTLLIQFKHHQISFSSHLRSQLHHRKKIQENTRKYKNTPSIMTTEQKSKIFQTSVEIRLMIFSYLLQSATDLTQQPKYLKYREEDSDHTANFTCDQAIFEQNDLHEFSKSFSLHPQILSTCQQFNSEGTALLYQDKTVHIDYIHTNNVSFGSVLGQSTLSAALKLYPLFLQVKNWHINVHFDERGVTRSLEEDTVVDSNASIIDERLAASIIDDVRALSNIKDLSNIELRLHADPDLAEREWVQNCLESSLAHYRSIRAIKCTAELGPEFLTLARAIKREIESEKSTVTPDIMILCRRSSHLSKRLEPFIKKHLQSRRSNDFELVDSALRLLHIDYVGWSIKGLTRYGQSVSHHNDIDLWVSEIEDDIDALKSHCQIELQELQRSNSAITRSISARMKEVRHDVAAFQEVLTQLEELEVEFDDIVLQWEQVKPLKGLEDDDKEDEDDEDDEDD